MPIFGVQGPFSEIIFHQSLLENSICFHEIHNNITVQKFAYDKTGPTNICKNCSDMYFQSWNNIKNV